MANDDTCLIPVDCPHCRAEDQIVITHPAHQAHACNHCGQGFIVDQTLIGRFYAGDNSAYCLLEDFYRAPLVHYFMKRGMLQVEAEECQIDVFQRIWETKYPQPGNAPQRYDCHHATGASFRTWVFRIALHILADRRRQPVLFSDLQESECDSGRGSTLAAIQQDLDFNRNPRPEDEAIAREYRAAVHDCHDKLPPRERLAITVWLEQEGAWGVGNILARELRTQFPGRGASAATASALLVGATEQMRECLEGKGITAHW